MITAALLLALQLADSVTAVQVRRGDTAATVPVVFTRSGPVVEGGRLASALGARLSHPSRDRAVLDIGAVRFDFTAGLPFVRVGGDAAPLGTPPSAREGAWYLPLTFATEVVPRFVAGYAFDRDRNELRRASLTVVASPGDVARPASAREPAAAPALDPSSTRSASRVPSAAAAKPRGTPPRPVIVVDAGHGGPDRGMTGTVGARRVYEADITLAVSRRVRDLLAERGVDVVMTRSTDTLIALADRGKIANRAGARLFLSIHVNAANPRWKNPRSARGFETYFLADAKTEDEQRVAEMENDADRYVEGIDLEPGDPLSFLLNDMKQNEYLRESSLLAQSVQTGLRRVHPGTDRGVKQAGFRVLISAHMPAVLVEIGFGTNNADAAYMTGATGQRAIAAAIADAALRYLGDYDRRVQAASAQR